MLYDVQASFTLKNKSQYLNYNRLVISRSIYKRGMDISRYIEVTFEAYKVKGKG